MTWVAFGKARLVVPGAGIAAAPGERLFMRVARDDLDLVATLPAAFAGVLITAAVGAIDVQRFGAALAVLEARSQREDGSLRIVAEIASGAGLLAAGSLAGSSRRLQAIAWDGEALARDLSARAARNQGGAWRGPCAAARSLVLAAAAAGRVEGIDAPFTGADDAAFRREAEDARHDGFSAKMALDENQAQIAAEIFG